MKATETQQTDLLSLANLDLQISRSKAAIKNLSSGAQFAELREAQRGLAAKLISARNALDSVELELKRAETDLHLVEQRIEKDKVRINSTNSSKDAQGIQSELESLARRKSDLEDIELAILDVYMLDQKCQVGVRVRDDIPSDFTRLPCHAAGMCSQCNDCLCHFLL